MPFTPPPTPPSTSDPADFDPRADAWVEWMSIHTAEMAAFAANLVAGLAGTSTSTVTIGLGDLSFTTQTGLGWQPGQTLVAAVTTSPANQVIGRVKTYDPVAGALVLSAVSYGGAGSYSAWSISLSAPVVRSVRNRLLNSAMMINQERAGASVTLSATPAYVVDQWWAAHLSDATITAQQVASTSPAGSPNRLRVSVTAADSSIAAGQYAVISQPVEGVAVADLNFGAAAAKSVAVRLGVKFPQGTYCVLIRNQAADRTYLAEMVIASAENNVDTVKTFVIPGDTTGTWLKTAGNAGLVLQIVLAGGSNFAGVTGWQAGNKLATSGQSNGLAATNTFELFDCGLYEGSDVPTSYEVPDVASELTKCLRFWRKSYKQAAVPGAVDDAGAIAGGVISSGAPAGFQVPIPFSPIMCKAPTVTYYSRVTGATGSWYETNAAADRAVTSTFTPSETGAVVTMTAAGSSQGAVVAGHYTANARL